MMPNFKRKPRQWLTLWTHSRSDNEITSDIREVADKFFPGVLIDIYTSTGPIKTLTLQLFESGQLFLHVCNPSREFLDAVGRVPGVGDCLEVKLTEPKPQQLERYFVSQVVEVGDKVIIRQGELKGAIGKVVAVGERIIVKLATEGMFLSLLYNPEEVEVIRDEQ